MKPRYTVGLDEKMCVVGTEGAWRCGTYAVYRNGQWWSGGMSQQQAQAFADYLSKQD